MKTGLITQPMMIWSLKRLMNNPYEPPSVPPQEDDLNISGAYKEFTLWSILIVALFFLLDSIRTVATSIVKNVILVIRYVIDLNH